MTPGALVRRMLGPWFTPVGELYRRIFVDLERVVDVLEPQLPQGAHCLDLGGGDGLVSNMLLSRRPDLRMTLIDVAERVGGFIEPRFADRVALRPATPLARLTAEGFRCDVVLMTDVVHHVPLDQRASFFGDLAAFCRSAGAARLLVKDVEPGSLRAGLGVLSDKYVTGDRQVSLLPHARLRAALEHAFGPDGLERFEASFPDHPNYCAVIRLRATAGRPPAA